MHRTIEKSDRNVKVYLVGGAVRDQLLGKQPKDFDYSVEAQSYEAMVSWISKQGKVFLESPKHFTVRAHLEGKLPADYVLCRKEGPYSDGRRPDWVEPGTLFDDLSRRDFTVNAIAFDEESKVYIDHFGGIDDLKKGILRCVGSARLRFKEDALRMLRAMRFKITKGFELDEAVKSSLRDPELIRLLSDNISADRKRDELMKCFSFDTVQTLSFLCEIGPDFQKAIFQGASPLWLVPTSKRVLGSY